MRKLYFNSRHQKNGWLSNTLALDPPMVIDGKEWKRVDQFYEATRYGDPEYAEVIRTVGGPVRLHALIHRKKLTGKEGSAPLSKEDPRPLNDIIDEYAHVQEREDWEEVRIPVLVQGVVTKFLSNPLLLEQLEKVPDNTYIVFHTLHDDFLGDGGDRGIGYKGENWLGRVLTALSWVIKHGTCDDMPKEIRDRVLGVKRKMPSLPTVIWQKIGKIMGPITRCIKLSPALLEEIEFQASRYYHDVDVGIHKSTITPDDDKSSGTCYILDFIGDDGLMSGHVGDEEDEDIFKRQMTRVVRNALLRYGYGAKVEMTELIKEAGEVDYGVDVRGTIRIWDMYRLSEERSAFLSWEDLDTLTTLVGEESLELPGLGGEEYYLDLTIERNRVDNPQDSNRDETLGYYFVRGEIDTDMDDTTAATSMERADSYRFTYNVEYPTQAVLDRAGPILVDRIRRALERLAYTADEITFNETETDHDGLDIHVRRLRRAEPAPRPLPR